MIRVYRLCRMELTERSVRLTNRTYDLRIPLTPAGVEKWRYFMTERWHGFEPHQDAEVPHGVENLKKLAAVERYLDESNLRRVIKLAEQGMQGRKA